MRKQLEVMQKQMTMRRQERNVDSVLQRESSPQTLTTLAEVNRADVPMSESTDVT